MTVNAETVGNQFGYLCPECHKGDELSVAAVVWAKLYPDGSDVEGDHEWDGNSAIVCGCGWSGKVHKLLKAVGFEDL